MVLAASRSWPLCVIFVWPGVNPDGNSVPFLCTPPKRPLAPQKKRAEGILPKDLWGRGEGPLSIAPPPLFPYSTTPDFPQEVQGPASPLSLQSSAHTPALPKFFNNWQLRLGPTAQKTKIPKGLYTSKGVESWMKGVRGSTKASGTQDPSCPMLCCP